MRLLPRTLACFAIVVCVTASEVTDSRTPSGLQRSSLCATTERVIFSCLTKSAKRSAPARKIVSLCASPNLTRDQGYLQYRYGLPGKIELEFPSSRTGTQQMFQYTHYMRYRVDLTEINFQVDGYDYQIFNTYNGEEKSPIVEQGVTVTAQENSKNATFNCVGKAKADYVDLSDVLNREPN